MLIVCLLRQTRSKQKILEEVTVLIDVGNYRIWWVSSRILLPLFSIIRLSYLVIQYLLSLSNRIYPHKLLDNFHKGR